MKSLNAEERTFQASDDYIQTKYVFERNFAVITPKKEKWQRGNANIDYYSHVYFTDGSVSRHGSGYGALYAKEHAVIKGQCGSKANITQAEIAAIHAVTQRYLW